MPDRDERRVFCDVFTVRRSQFAAGSAQIAREREAMCDVVYTRTDDRSNVGVLTEFRRLLAFDLSEPSELPLLDLSLRLAWTPIVARKTFPVDATCKLFGVEPPRRDWSHWRAETVGN
ncbi:MAG TPA: hypothetical protein VIV40_21265 [Kofleriaceae bacterium]